MMLKHGIMVSFLTEQCYKNGRCRRRQTWPASVRDSQGSSSSCRRKPQRSTHGRDTCRSPSGPRTTYIVSVSTTHPRRACWRSRVHPENVIVTRRATAAAAGGVAAVSGGDVTRAAAHGAWAGPQRARRAPRGAAGRDQERERPPRTGAWSVWGGRAGRAAGGRAGAGRARRRPSAPRGAAGAS
jgi:hypothetical protein